MGKLFSLLLLVSSLCFAQKPSVHIIFLSDTQQPMWIETLRLKENNNEDATRKIYSAILSDSSAVAVYHLGDVTSIGMFSSFWKDFDEFQKGLHIPLHPVLGNHDYYIFPGAALEQFYKRYPAFSLSWYSTKFKHVGIISLNSNFSHLSEEERIQQQAWYYRQLSEFDTDSTVNAVIVVCHHSPFTNSTIVSPDIDVQYDFVAPFLMYEKCKVFISGHAHAYEHFQKNGKDFFVIGGGGGLLHPLLTLNDERFRDVYSQSISPRFFHYVTCTVQHNSLQFVVKRLRNDHSGFDTADTVSVPVAR